MNYDAVTLVPAHGRITLDGQPLPSAVVTFEAADSQFSYGMTDPNGEYELQFDTVAGGVTPSAKTVRISTTRKILGLNTEDGEGEVGATPVTKPAPGAEKVPPKYNAKSELKIEVKPDQTEYDFDLVSK